MERRFLLMIYRATVIVAKIKIFKF